MKQAGFSLIELMVAIAVLVAITAIGVPNLKSMLGNSQIRTVAESIKNGLQVARVEAIKRNAKVAFTLNANTSWQVGCQTVVQETCPAIIQSKNMTEGSSSNIALTITSGNSVIFNSFGLRDSASTINRVDVSNSNLSAAEQTELRVIINAGGNAKVCDPAIATAGDPRKC